jgi:phosphohistidine phosphatase SixA
VVRSREKVEMGEARAQQLTIVRHAVAGRRASFDGPDTDRPLTKRGRAQARALVEPLAHSDVRAIVSSPARRCIETVTPLAEHLGMAVETVDALSEDSTGDAALAALLARGSETSGIVVGSSHGPIFDDLLRLAAAELAISGLRQISKAGRLELTLSDGVIVAIEAFAAPEIED